MFVEIVNIGLVTLWAIIACFITYRSWQARRRRVGITISYVAFFALYHWLPILIIMFPWFEPRHSEELNWLGFYQSLIALVSFMIGTLVVATFLKNFHLRKIHVHRKSTRSVPVEPSYNLPKLYIILGLVFIFVVSPIVGRIPTISAFASGMSSLFQAGMFLLLWQGYERQSRKLILLAWCGVIVWPIITVVTAGFLVFATSFVISFSIFSLHLVKKPVRHIILLPVVAYIALSFFTGYYSVRADLRGTIWYGGEDASLSVRAQLAGNLIHAFHFFDLTNPEHLAPIDERINYNQFTGLTLARIQDGVVDYAYGSTIVDAMLMVIPRAIWLDKPISLGGDEIVEYYAGVGLLQGSLSPGNLMEFYLNFGTLGVIIGFMLLGTVVGISDEMAGVFLARKDLFNFAAILVPSFSFLVVGGALAGIVGSAVSGFLTVSFANVWIRAIASRKIDRERPVLKKGSSL